MAILTGHMMIAYVILGCPIFRYGLIWRKMRKMWKPTAYFPTKQQTELWWPRLLLQVSDLKSTACPKSGMREMKQNYHRKYGTNQSTNQPTNQPTNHWNFMVMCSKKNEVTFITNCKHKGTSYQWWTMTSGDVTKKIYTNQPSNTKKLYVSGDIDAGRRLATRLG